MFDITGEEARLLLNVALMATGQNRFQSAAKILAALGRFRPEEASVASANAILLISMLDFQGAVDYLDREVQKGFNRGRSGGRKRGSETPPTPMSGTPTPSPEAHWLGRGGGPPGTVSMHTHSELEKNEEVRGLSRNQGSQGGHPRGRSSRECRRHRGEASVGFGGEARGAWAGGWSGCCSHTSPEWNQLALESTVNKVL